MATLPLSLATRIYLLNYETAKLTATSYNRHKGINGVEKMGPLGRIQLRKDGSRDATRSIRRDSNTELFASAQSSTYQTGLGLHTRSETEELANSSTYLFRTDIGGQVKVYVGTKDMKYLVYIEVSLPQWSDAEKLVSSWRIFRSNSLPLIPLKSQSSASQTRPSTGQAPFIQKSPGMLALKLEFELNQAPFYLSFVLKPAPYATSSNTEIKSHRNTSFCVPVGLGSGYPYPLGISFSKDGSVNFSLFSKNAGSVTLCLYDEMADKPSLEIDLDPYINRTGDIWHVKVESVAPYASYSYRCNGAISQGSGDTSQASHVFLDPYSKILQSFSTHQSGSVSLTKSLGSLLEEHAFDWSGEARPSLPMEKLVVYRLNVERFTGDKSSDLPTEIAGTFSGLVEKLNHFKTLGVNAVLLEPIFPYDEQKGPYFPYHFFSPMNSYVHTGDGISAIKSMKETVKVFHANNIEVLLEVVFTHTAEGLGLQGIDDSSYYVFDRDAKSGAGNFLKCNYPVVQQLVLDSLRHWVMEFHIDGFCFMDASSLLRGSGGESLSRPPLIEAIAFDPLLSKTKIIADCWDPYDMASKDIRFPHWKRWAEMNSKFCYDVRNFLRGKGLLSPLATRLCGSGDILLGGRGPAFSFNFIARNFGLPLVDLVSFSSGNLSSELSWNCGEEGPTNKSIVLERRLKQIRNFLFILYISQGVPVLNMGDECGQSCGGSASYGDRRPFDWDALRTSFGAQMTQFIAFLGLLRARRADLFQRKNFLGEENIDWQGSDQAEPRWEDPSSKFLAMILKADREPNSEASHDGVDLFVAFNASDHLENLILPPPSEGMAWFLLVDTALPFPGFFLTDGAPVIEQMEGSFGYEMKSHSCALFESRNPID